MSGFLLATIATLAVLTSWGNANDRHRPHLGSAAIAVAADTGKKKADKLNINTATREELAAVPGIGEAYAAKVIAGRPYEKKGELVTKQVLPDSVYAKVKAFLTAKAAK